MTHEFTVAVAGGSLTGWEHGDPDGLPLLVLHGGPMKDATASMVDTLPPGLRTIRYQQRGIPPSVETGPFDIETHVADAIAILDARTEQPTWLLGHSWGGHLACHVAVAHPDRVAGVICLGALGAVPDGGWSGLDTNIFARLAAHDPAGARRAQELDAAAMAGEGTPEEALESMELVWPYYFAHPETAPPLPEPGMSVELYAGAVTSVHEHFERETLVRGLPTLTVPFAVVHGEQDPLPVEAAVLTAGLVPHSTLELIPDCGHMVWMEQPERFREAIARTLGLST